MLGAACLGDIGLHFPDTDPAYKNISSKILLQKTFALINGRFSIINIDCTICLETPKIRPYAEKMQQVIAAVLDCAPGDVSIKATTTEQLGFVGREEGIIAFATIFLKERE
jgi:2-C-methyl-D-erythritol 2,4-cyclodiphosphate synthase